MFELVAGRWLLVAGCSSCARCILTGCHVGRVGTDESETLLELLNWPAPRLLTERLLAGGNCHCHLQKWQLH